MCRKQAGMSDEKEVLVNCGPWDFCVNRISGRLLGKFAMSNVLLGVFILVEGILV